MALVAQSDLAEMPKNSWHGAVFADFDKRLTAPSEFPCTFSQNAWRRQLLQFSLINDPGGTGFQKGLEDIREYLAECREWDGRVNSAKPMLMVFSHKAAQFDRLEDYHDYGWQALQYWHEHDLAPLPEDNVTPPGTCPFGPLG